MKLLNRLRFFILAGIVLGCFANFAQNEYGMGMVMWGTLFLGLTWLLNLGVLGSQMWKKKGVAVLLISTVVLFVISVFLFTNFINNTMGFTMLALLGVLVIELFIVALAGRKQNPSGTSLAIESFGLFLLFMGAAIKLLHWPGSGISLILGGSILVIIYLIGSVKLFNELKNDKMIALFSFIFQLNIILGVAGTVFKNQHWPGSVYFFQIEIMLLVLLLIPVLLNVKFKLGAETVSLMHLRTRSSVLLFLFIFLNYWALFFSLQAWGVGPKFYTLARPPALEKMLEKSANGDDPQIQAYQKNYSSFLEKRNDSENK